MADLLICEQWSFCFLSVEELEEEESESSEDDDDAGDDNEEEASESEEEADTDKGTTLLPSYHYSYS